MNLEGESIFFNKCNTIGNTKNTDEDMLAGVGWDGGGGRVEGELGRGLVTRLLRLQLDLRSVWSCLDLRAFELKAISFLCPAP